MLEQAAQNRMELIVPQLAKQYGVTEKLKAENQMEWVRQMNACKAQAEAIVKFELIYDWYRDRPDKKSSGGSCADGRKIHILMLYFNIRRCIMLIKLSQSVHKGMLL